VSRSNFVSGVCHNSLITNPLGAKMDLEQTVAQWLKMSQSNVEMFARMDLPESTEKWQFAVDILQAILDSDYTK
jgi:hypothetical protein